MDDRRRFFAALTVLIGFVIIVMLIIGIVSGKNIVSPVPEDKAIKVIFITPTPTITLPSPSPIPTVSTKSALP